MADERAKKVCSKMFAQRCFLDPWCTPTPPLKKVNPWGENVPRQNSFGKSNPDYSLHESLGYATRYKGTTFGREKKLRQIILTRGRNPTNIAKEKPLKRFRLNYKIFFGE